MKIAGKFLAAGMVGVFVTSSAMAEGFFVGGELGGASFSNANIPGQAVGTYPNPGIISVVGGYRFTPYVGVEAAFSTLGDSTVNYGNASTTLKTSVAQVAAVGTVPVSPRFDLFGKLGVAAISADVSGTGAATGFTASSTTTNLMFGIGGQFNIGRHFSIPVQYQNFGKAKFTATQFGVAVPASSIGVSAISAGFLYNF